MTQKKWRFILGRLPLPMLALAASHGVYSFGTLYMPWYFALISAAAFELTYVGLAVANLQTDDERRRARNISVGAVVVSILYNAVAAYFHRNPSTLVDMRWQAEAGLALLHAAPLATVAYLVASLLLHSESVLETSASTSLAVNADDFSPKITVVNRPIPASMRPRQLPAPSLTAAYSAVDSSRVDDWIAQNDGGTSYAEISRQLGGKPSKAYIGSCCKRRRQQLTALKMEATND